MWDTVRICQKSHLDSLCKKQISTSVFVTHRRIELCAVLSPHQQKLVAAICDAQVDQLQQRMVRQKSQRFLRASTKR